MPYIPTNDREDITLWGMDPKTAGQLNYAFTKLINDYWIAGGNYQTINDIVGALEGAKMEFVRQVVNPYEDWKIKENGPIYE